MQAGSGVAAWAQLCVCVMRAVGVCACVCVWCVCVCVCVRCACAKCSVWCAPIIGRQGTKAMWWW